MPDTRKHRTRNSRVATHPGEILRADFLEEFGLSANKLARDIDVPANRLTDIIRGKRTVTADTALRLSAYFGTTARFWMNLQASWDLCEAERSSGAAIRAAIRRDPEVEAHLAKLKAEHPEEMAHVELSETEAAE